MILHWLTSGWRSLIANPLFSLITVISLAIGCCGALLAGSNIKQHLSFEQWVPDGEQIYVVTRRQKEQPQVFGNLPAPSMRQEGPASRRPSTAMSMPMRAAIEGRIAGLDVQTRVVRGGAVLQEDQDEIDRRQQAGPLAPGEIAPPFKGTIYVDDDFFKVFPLEFVEGSGEKLKEPDTIVLTQARAKRLFGNEPAAGQSVEGVQGKSLRVIGVVRDLPVATHLVFESVAGMRAYEQMTAANQAAEERQIVFMAVPAPPGGAARPPALPPMPVLSEWNRFIGGVHYLKRAKDTDPEAFKAAAIRELQAAADIGARQNNQQVPAGVQLVMQQWEYSVVPLLDTHLAGPDVAGIPSTGDITMLTTLAVAAIALLAVSAFNYVTLSLARSLRRRREVAVRKVLGASQGSLIQQYLTESGMVTAIALAIGFALAWFLHPWFARAIGQPETLFDLFDPVFLAISLVGFALLAVAVGAYPALYLSNVRPRTGLGEGGTASPGRIGQAVTAGLLGLQIAAATGLLVVALTMAAQANFIETRPMGFDIKNKFTVNANCSLPDRANAELAQQMMRRCMGGTRELLGQTPEITKVAYFQGQLVAENVNTQAFGRTAQGEEIGRAVRMGVDTEALQFMGAKLLAGRFFDSSSAYDSALIEQRKAMMTMMASMSQAPGAGGPRPPPSPTKVPVIVTKAWLPLLGVATPEEAIGLQIATKPRAQFPFEVVGVVEDWHQRPLKYDVLPIVFVPDAFQGAMIESDSTTADLRNSLTAKWRRITGDERVMVNVTSLEDNLERVYQTDFRLMRAVSGFAVVAIIVAGLGVYGLSAFEMRRRVREIGIRKALGASPMMVGGMVIGRAVVFAGIASLLAWPVGFWLANEWLMDFIYRTELGWVAPLFATLIVIAFVALAVGLSSARAAAMRPAGALQ
jgi:putative ABC transport system permease protein